MMGTEQVIRNIVSVLADEMIFEFVVPEKMRDECVIPGTKIENYHVIPEFGSDPLEHHGRYLALMRERSRLYDAVWENRNNFGNVDLIRYATRFGIPKRIVHAHASNALRTGIRKLQDSLNKAYVRRRATDRWACSTKAGSFGFGDASFVVVPNAFDTKRYRFSSGTREEIRRQLDVENCFVVGTVGRLESEKNYSFLVSAFCELLKLRPDARLLFVGDGSMRSELQEQMFLLGLNDKVKFVGYRPDAERYLNAFDVFALPSLFEGLGLSLIEAQFNGLPCIASTGVPSEASISNALSFLSTERESDAERWGRELSMAKRESVRLTDDAKRYDLYSQKATLAGLFK